jgi:predicted DNA-binding transcriptional regulator YafY
MIALPKTSGQQRGMRYGPAENLFRLARHLAATRTGPTLDEMAAELDVGRRTAERMRDTLLAMFPGMDSWDDDARVRRWRLPGSALVGVVEPRAEAVAAIETAARECEVRGETDRAALLREASTTLRAVMRPDALLHAETDIAALMEAEGIAMRPGPRPIIASGVLATLRRAILGMQLVVMRYAGPGAEEPATRILCPYGILYSMAGVVGWSRMWTGCRRCGCGGWTGSFRPTCLTAASGGGTISACRPTRRGRLGCFRKNRSTWCCGSRRMRQKTRRDGCFTRRRAWCTRRMVQ